MMGQGLLPQHRSLYSNQNDMPIWHDGPGQSSLIDTEDEAKHFSSNPMEAYRGSTEGALHSFMDKVLKGTSQDPN